VVLVGTAIGPGSPSVKDDGTEVNTLWGELAWQLGGREAFDLVAEDDRNKTSPGVKLNRLFETYAPCMVLIDEWVAYARQLYNKKEDLPAGSFDTHFTFAQALTEAADAVAGTFLVISMPASDIEKGGEGGEAALERLDNLVGRKDSPWRPATAEESFEIVRRRLFNDVSDKTQRDAVVKAFGELYRSQSAEFPSECREAEYERRLTGAYPIHPELFARLYDDWSALETFQRTRGVLRLMAAAIHSLWEKGDTNLLIMPGNLPLDAGPVQRELLGYLPDQWVPVVDRDVDGDNSLPLKIDRENPALGRLSAARRVARTLFLGSAATSGAAHQGLEDQKIRLGCVQPGESSAVFGDALRRLSDQATFLYQDGKRYWFSMQPTITRLAQDRASTFSADQVHLEVVRRLKEDRQRGDFGGVHIAPEGPAQIADESDARLVVLDPEFLHTSKKSDSEAQVQATLILEQRGSGPRQSRNMLVFAGADKAGFESLDRAIRTFLAWNSIDREKEELNLDGFQRSQAEDKRRQNDETVDSVLRETYRWLLVPTHSSGDKPVAWQEVKIPGGEGGLAARASKKLKEEELLITEMAGVRLRLELDRVPLWDHDRIGTKHLWELMSQYLYLPRLANSGVLVDAIRNGVASLTWESDTFAYADGYDEKEARFVGLAAGQHVGVVLDGSSVLVKPEAAAAQLQKQGISTAKPPSPGPGPEPGPVPDEVLPRRFFGTIRIDATRMTRLSADIAEAIVQHLNSLPGAEVEIRLDIQAQVPEGVPENVVRTVNENAFTLKFDDFSFEES
jgi:predicted AAA+ superfamily ATPase